MHKLLAAVTLAAITALSPLSADEANPFIEANEIDISLAETFHLVREFPDSAFDSGYYTPTRAELEEIIRFYLLKRDLDRWVEEASDCDDMGREFLHVSHVWLRRTFPRLPASISVGMVYVEIDGDYGPLAPSSAGERTQALHVLNVVLLADGSFVFVEPQTGLIATAAEMECAIHVFRVDL